MSSVIGSSGTATSSGGDFHGIPIEKEDPEKLFEQLSVLGKGTFGTVYKMRNRLTNEIVAIKEIVLGSQDEMDIVRREIRILHDCSHRNIVAYRGTYLTLSALWIAMEYCAGGSVDGIYKRLKVPLTEPLIAYVCREVLEGLLYLHAHHKIHRDIKGGNVLLTERGEVKLADFGVSTELLHTLSKRNSFIGTLYWMAPEAIQEKEYDERADVWSLGITVIEMAEGCPPRSGYPYARALFAIPKEPPPRLTQRADIWSPLLHKFVERMLEKDPRKRPTAQQMLLDPFLAPDRLGTAAELQEWIRDVIAKSELLSTARRLGEESTGSSATFVQRDGSDSRSSADFTDIDDDDTRKHVTSGGAAVQEAKASAAAQLAAGGVGAQSAASLEAANVHPMFLDGTLLQLPLLHTDDISLDELGAGTSSIAPIAVVPGPVELLAEGSDALECTEVPEMNETIKNMLALFYYHRDVAYQSGVSVAAAERSQHLAQKYGSALKTILRI